MNAGIAKQEIMEVLGGVNGRKKKIEKNRAYSYNHLRIV